MRFPGAQIKHWADRYSYPDDDSPMVALGRKARARGHLDRESFLQLAHWKAPRIVPRCSTNETSLIDEVTRMSFSAKAEQLRIGALLLLNGVGYPMASVILHFCHKDSYPILDFRALWSLGTDEPNDYKFNFWFEYARFCRETAAAHQVDMRTFDRALWQFSKEKQVE
jgi:hypothetical protein